MGEAVYVAIVLVVVLTCLCGAIALNFQEDNKKVDTQESPQYRKSNRVIAVVLAVASVFVLVWIVNNCRKKTPVVPNKRILFYV